MKIKGFSETNFSNSITKLLEVEDFKLFITISTDFFLRFSRKVIKFFFNFNELKGQFAFNYRSIHYMQGLKSISYRYPKKILGVIHNV